MIRWTAPFSMTLNDPYPRFQGHAIFDAEYLRNGTIYRHSFNGILIGTYTRPTQQCRFEWPWVILSDLAKYSMTSGVARSLCDSWASCSSRSHVTRLLTSAYRTVYMLIRAVHTDLKRSSKCASSCSFYALIVFMSGCSIPLLYVMLSAVLFIFVVLSLNQAAVVCRTPASIHSGDWGNGSEKGFETSLE